MAALVYQYVIGGILFVSTLAYCLKVGAVDHRSPSDRATVAVLWVGLAGYLALHLAWTLLAGGR